MTDLSLYICIMTFIMGYSSAHNSKMHSQQDATLLDTLDSDSVSSALDLR